MQAAWDVDARQLRQAAHAAARQLAEAQAEAVAAAASAQSQLSFVLAERDAACEEATQLHAELTGSEWMLKAAEAGSLGFDLPQRNDRLDWVAADVATSQAVAADAGVASAPDAAGGTAASADAAASTPAVATDGRAERQDSTVTELHMQVPLCELPAWMAISRKVVQDCRSAFLAL